MGGEAGAGGGALFTVVEVVEQNEGALAPRVFCLTVGSFQKYNTRAHAQLLYFLASLLLAAAIWPGGIPTSIKIKLERSFFPFFSTHNV